MFIIDGVDCDHMFEINQEITHNLSPAGPTNAFVHLERVNEQLGDLALVRVDQERNSELL